MHLLKVITCNKFYAWHCKAQHERKVNCTIFLLAARPPHTRKSAKTTTFTFTLHPNLIYSLCYQYVFTIYLPFRHRTYNLKLCSVICKNYFRFSLLFPFNKHQNDTNILIFALSLLILASPHLSLEILPCSCEGAVYSVCVSYYLQ